MMIVAGECINMHDLDYTNGMIRIQYVSIAL